MGSDMVKDHSDSERGNPLPPLHGLLLAASGLLYAPSHRQDSTYHGICYTNHGALAAMKNSLIFFFFFFCSCHVKWFIFKNELIDKKIIIITTNVNLLMVLKGVC